MSARTVRLLSHLVPPALFALATVPASGIQRTALAQDRPPAESDARHAADDWFQPEADAESLKLALGEQIVSDRWVYHDLDAARRLARETGKPIVAVFRCVPCGAAPGLDGAVCTAGGVEASKFEAQIRAAGGDLDELLERFVTVRMVKMNGVNRRLFQFDRDVPYVAMFLNADGAVYGRYGTSASGDRKNLPRHNLSSFQQSLRRALELHRDYPKNKGQLAAKRAETKGAFFAEEMDAFEPFPEKFNPMGVKNCIHCHTVGEAEVRQSVADGSLSLRDVWPFPLPENIGLKIDVEDGLRVESVAEDSPAAKAGIQRGDALLELAGQPLISEADVQWALHHAPNQGTLPVRLRRGAEAIEREITLQGDWRRRDGHWRASLAPLRPGVHLRPDPYRVKKGAAPGQMGLGVFYPRGPAAQAGLRNGDLLVAVDGRTDMRLEADFLKYIHIDRPQAKSVELTTVRKGAKSTVTLPIR